MAIPTKMTPDAIGPDQWNEFLAEFARNNRGSHARLEVFGAEPTHVVLTEDRHFEGISADNKDAERAVWITFGSTPQDHFTHGIQMVTAIRVRPPTGTAGAALEIEELIAPAQLLV